MSQSMKVKGVGEHEEVIRVSEPRLIEYVGSLWWDGMMAGGGGVEGLQIEVGGPTSTSDT